MMRRISIKLASAFLLAILALGFSIRAHAQSTPLSGFALGALPNPVGEGFYTTITGVVFGSGVGAPTPDGQIDFFISGDPTDCNYYLNDIGTGTVNSAGEATVSFYAGNSGTVPICGNYTSSESGYAPATAGPFVLTVYAPTTMLVYVPGASVPGANVTFNVVLTLPSGQPAPTGTITLEDPNNGDSVVGSPATVGSYTLNGQSVIGATITTNQLTGNQYLAAYSGDGNYSPESVQGTIFLENPLTSVTPASFIAGAVIPTQNACLTATGTPGLQVTLTGIGFNTSTTAQILIGGLYQSLEITGSSTTQLTTCIPATALTAPATLQIETNTSGQNATGGPVAFQVYAPFSINTTVASNPSTFAYGSNLASIISGTGTRTAATDAAVPAGTVTFDLTGTSGTVTLGTAQFTQSTTTTGTYQSPLMAPFDTNSTQKMISADLNGDGYADVVGMPGTYYGSPAASPYLQIFLSTGANSFQSEQQVYTGCAAQDFAVGDIDGDSVPDLVVVCPGVSTPGFSNPLQAYYMHGNGDGTFGAPVIFGTGSYVSSPTQVVLGWFNNDGYNDIAVIDGVDGYLQIISPIPNTYDNYVYFDAYDYGSVFSAGAADFNQDGLTDIVLGEYSYSNGGGAVLPLINAGSGNSFNTLTPSQFNATTYYMWNMAITDLNGDGYPDVAIADPGIVEGTDTGNVLTFENDQNGNLPLTNTYPLNYVGAVAGPPFPIIGQPSNAAVAPGWNLVYSAYGTSDNDIFVGELQRQNATTWTQLGSAVDTGTYPWETEGGPLPGLIVAGDLNGDGYLDFAASGLIYDDGAPSGSLEELVPYYYGNDAQVTFNNATELPPPGTYTLSMLYPGNQLYQLNNSATTTITITQATPTISWTPPAAITYGTALGATQLDATASVPGTFSYNPAQGAVLTAGSQEISVTFTPTDDVDYSSASIMVPITVLQATPTVSWTNPSAINYGTALGGVQLDATASVPGTFAYNPGAGTVLAAGTQPLSATFTPTDAIDYVSGEVANASIVVNQSSTTVTWANPAAITYGTALSATQLNATASVPGTFTYNPAATTVLTAGVHTLDVTFTPTDTADYQNSTGSVSITVNQATPTVTWGAPAAIDYGTALSATQLDATASVPGTFTYNPAATTLLTAGTHTLGVTFTPTDAVDYQPVTKFVSITVNQVASTVTWTAPAAITYGTALSATQLDATATVPGTFAYDPASGTVLTAGTHTLSVTFTPTDSVDYASSTGSVSITVNKATPTVTWAAPAGITYGTALSAVQLNATGSVPGVLTYTPAAGTVLTAGTQTLSVTLSPTDGTDYKAVTKTVAIVVGQASATVNWTAPAAITYGTSLSAAQLNATASVPGTFAYNPGTGTVLAAGVHALSVTFTPTDAVDYAGETVGTIITVNQATPTVTWANPAAINYGTALGATQLDATASVPGTFAYNPVAGTVLTAGTHSLGVTFTPTDSTDYASVTANASIVVNQSSTTVTWTAPAAITYGTALSATQLDATASVPGTFVYSPAVGTVLTAGTHTLDVTFTPTDATDYSGSTSSVSITVNQATPTVTWATPAGITYGTALSATQLNATASVPGTFAYSPGAGTLLTAGSHTLSVTFSPTDAVDYKTAVKTVTIAVGQGSTTVTWNAPAAISYGTALSSAQLNATASVAGTFAYNPGAGTVLTGGTHTLSVTFTPTDSTDYTGSTASVSITVNQATPTVSWNSPAAINYGTALGATQLDATASVPGTFAYNPGIGTVLTAGTHSLAVTFTPTDNTDYAVATANATIVVNRTSTTVTWNAPAAITYGTALSATQLDASASVPGTFAYNPGIGTVLTAGAHTLSVTFTPTDTTDYTASTSSVSISVNQATPTVTWNAPSAINYGTALSVVQLNATASVPGSFTYNPALGTVLTAGTHALAVTFTPTDGVDYKGASATQFITVNQVGSTVTWTAPAAINYGTPLSATQLNATASVPGTFAYNPAPGTVLTAGTHQLAVTFTPTDSVDYKSSSAAVSITVNQGTPTVTWSAPGAINYGTALSAAQLNATASVPGTFTYTPASGTVLAAGSHQLSVTFAPTDGTDYATITANTTIVVNQATSTVTWNAPSAITYGTALSATQLDATSSVPGAFAYNPALGTVLKAGAHTLGVTFTPTDATDYQGSTASVSIQVNQATPTITWPTPTAVAFGTQLSAAQLDATASTPGTFAYTPPAGTSLTGGSHTLSVSFTPTDATDYTTATGSVTIQVTQGTPVITWPSPGNMSYGTPLGATQLDATATPAGGTFTYNPPAGTTLPIGTQTLSVSYVPTDTTDYTTATATTTVNVIAGLTLTSVVPNSAPYGSAATKITLTGIGFTENSVVKLNGTAIATTYASPTQLTAQIPASFFQQLAAGTITVFDTARNLTTTSVPFTVTLPNLEATFSGPGTAAPGEQPTLNLVLSQPYPIAIQGNMTLTVDPLKTGGPVDPAVQFSTGGTTFNFTIPAGSTTTPNVQIQTGTISSTITVTLTLQASGQDIQPPSAVVVIVPDVAPVITSATLTRNGDSLTVTIQGYSSTRDMSEATFDFTAAPGSSISTPELKVDVASDFVTWYSSDTSVQYGSSFTYSQVFNLSNDASTIGSVSVVLTNSVGQSNQVTAQ